MQAMLQLLIFYVADINVHRQDISYVSNFEHRVGLIYRVDKVIYWVDNSSLEDTSCKLAHVYYKALKPMSLVIT